jgi:hypothetical protein
MSAIAEHLDRFAGGATWVVNTLVFVAYLSARHRRLIPRDRWEGRVLWVVVAVQLVGLLASSVALGLTFALSRGWL